MIDEERRSSSSHHLTVHHSLFTATSVHCLDSRPHLLLYFRSFIAPHPLAIIIINRLSTIAVVRTSKSYVRQLLLIHL